MLTVQDQDNLLRAGRSPELVLRQLEQLRLGSSSPMGLSPATIEKGIRRLSPDEQLAAIQVFNSKSDTKRWMKFVPASGAASRMFAPFYKGQEILKNKKVLPEDLLNLFHHLKQLPFYSSVYTRLTEEKSTKISPEEAFNLAFIDQIVNPKKMGFPKLPKALIPFFTDEYGNEFTAFEAQLLETIQLADNNPVSLHLTIDKSKRAWFEAVESQFFKRFSKRIKVPISVEYSYQHSLTDTPFLDANGNLLRNEEGAIAFRKGGHGALLENLNRLEADGIWIKNIDNILMGTDNESGVSSMKMLAGYLLTLQSSTFELLHSLELLKNDVDVDSIVQFIKNHFDTEFSLKCKTENQIDFLYDYLHRPLRVCGMIPNAGAKGGGPFWKKCPRGNCLQIVEGMELNTEDAEHQKTIQESTHFNPVIMVCGITDHKGEKFSLYDFRDEQRFMVSSKTINGQQIKILEWPGLWNGGMAEWNTVFIELDPNTFHPVKSVADLIR